MSAEPSLLPVGLSVDVGSGVVRGRSREQQEDGEKRRRRRRREVK
jgi:hypothetical protein